MNEFVKRAWLGLALCCGLVSAANVPAAESSYPAQPVRLMVGFAPGGPTDVLARILAQRLTTMWGQSVIVENKTGASGVLALQAVARSAPDGLTVGVLTFNHVVAETLLPQVPYHITTDLVPVVGIARQPNVLVVNPSLPVKDMPSLLAYLKQNKGHVTYASGGVGSPAHIAGALFGLKTGVEMVHVPYKGAAPGLTDVAAGQVSLMFAAAPPALTLVRADKLRAIATTGEKRMAIWPDLPTLKETGSDVVVHDWQGLVVPAGTPAAIVQKLNADVVRVLSDPAVRNQVAQLGGETTGGSVTDFNAFVQGELKRWREVVRDAHISAN